MPPPDGPGVAAASSAPVATDEQNAWVLEHLGVDMCLPGYPEPEAPPGPASPPLPGAPGNDADGGSSSASGVEGGEVCAQPPTPAGQPAEPAPQPSPPSGQTDRVIEAIKLAAGKLGGAVGDKLMELTTPANVAILVTFAGVYVAAQATPAGWIADGLALGMLVASAVMVGASLGAVIADIRAFISITADPNGNLDQAADHLARAVAALGVDTLVAILLHKAGSAAKPYIKPPAGTVEMVTPDGMVVRVPETALEAPSKAPSSSPLKMEGGPSEGAPPKGEAAPKAAEPADVHKAVAKGDMDAAAIKLGELGTNAKLDSLKRLTPEELAQLHTALKAKFGPNSPEARIADPVHRENLIKDPATKQSRANERDTALRLEQRDKIELERYEPKPGDKGDFKDPKSGKIYDGCSPGPAKHFDSGITTGKYAKSLVSHLENPHLDHVIIDVTDLGLSAQQLATLDALVAKVAGPNAAKIVRIP